MSERIDSPVSVSMYFDSKKNKVYPRGVIWNNRLYAVTKVGLHHTYREGRTLFHIFSVATPTSFFRLKLNTENLFWSLEEVGENFN